MSMEFYTEKWVKARKVHICHICGDEIPTGTVYSRESGKFDGDFFDCCTCEDCYRHRNEYCAQIEPEYGDLSISYYLQEEYCLKICNDEERANCMENLWHCPKLIDAQRAKVSER